MNELIHRVSSRQMGRGNMRRAVARIQAELFSLIDEAPPGGWADSAGVKDDLQDSVAELMRQIDRLWS